MRKFFIGLVILFVVPEVTKAGGGEYSVLNIDPLLLKDANAVLRLEELRLEINGTDELVFRNHYVVTILNENGDRWAQFVEYYDSFQEILSVEGVLYDALGNQVKKIKKRDLEDQSAVSSISLIEDNRIKKHNFYYKTYPYTIDYTVETRKRSTMFFPRWVPAGGERLSVEKSSMTIVCPGDYKLRYKAFNYHKDPVVTTEKNRQTYVWSVSKLSAIVRELYSPMWHELAPMVIFGPSDFQMAAYKGNMDSWEEYGRFIHQLNDGRDQIPPAIKDSVQRITSGIRDIREKVTRLYQFMQRNTRYISIQLGIGGFQPFAAKDVGINGYGDCKALSNYMYSLLKAAGIRSNYALIRAGEYANYITHDFPSQQFNHAILCVPLPGSDSIWLECTSQSTPAGYLGDFTSDRHALLITESGGKLVRTPRYDINENQQVRKVKASLQSDGTLVINANNHYTGILQDDIHAMINFLSREKVKERLNNQLDFSTYDISAFEYKEQKASLPSISESLGIQVSNYATITGKRLFIVPNVMTRWNRKLSADSTRKYDIQLGYGYRNVDSVEIEIPRGYEPESLPSPIKLESKFGKYSCSVELKSNTLVYKRSFEHNSGRFSAKEYNELVEFYNAVFKADRARVVLVKQEEPKKAF